MKTTISLLLILLLYSPGHAQSNISTFDISTFNTSTFALEDPTGIDAKENFFFETTNFETTKAGFPLWIGFFFLYIVLFFYFKYAYLNLSINLYNRFRCNMQIYYLEKSFIEKKKYNCPYPYLSCKKHVFDLKIWKAQDLLCAFDKDDFNEWLQDQNWKPTKLISSKLHVQQNNE